MNTYWSTYVQTTEELYASRSLRFNDRNKDHWLCAIGAVAGNRVLEIGCGGGNFCHNLKKYVPEANITGMDLDSAHIEFAKAKAEELGLDCTFVGGDATELPFEDGTFDIVFSHTVSEHVPPDPFYGEQYRILRSGGRIVVFSARPKYGLRLYSDDITDEENSLMEKLWKDLTFPDSGRVGAYEIAENEYPKTLAKYGFHDVTVDMFTVMEYCPDNAGLTREEAIGQINVHRASYLEPIKKARFMNPTGLSDAEYERLAGLINQRFDERIRKFERGEKVWDMASAAILAVSGVK